MNKFVSTIKKNPFALIAVSIYALSALMIAGGLIYIAINYRALPETLGCHFDAEGKFDVFWNKKYAFLHPVIAEFFLYILFGSLSIISFKLKPSKRLSDRGQLFIAGGTSVFCSMLALSWTVFFGVWINCVVTRRFLPTAVPVTMIFIDAFLFFALFILIVIACARYRKANER